MKRAWIVLAACAVLAGGVCADELHLKDGSVINGTIVGFDENSFKVKTTYGYAMVRRDQVVSIVVTDTDADAAKKPAANPNVSPKPNTIPAPAAPAAAAGGSNLPAGYSSANAPHPSNTSKPAPVPTPPAVKPVSNSTPAPAALGNSASAPAPATIAPTKKEMAPPTKRGATSAAPAAKPPAISAASPAVIPVSAPPAIPAPKPPEPIRESIDGNTYINDTYGFRMFRPPGWDVIEEARSVLPGAIAALGTSDQTTYLLVGAGPSAGSLEADLKVSDRKLNEMVENYRPLGDKTSTIAGLPAIERRFRGGVDGKDWSGTVVLIERGKELYTIFGMTYAGSDLVQIQENVIHRAITSLKFTR